MKRIIIMSLVILIHLPAFGQSLQDDLSRMYKQYEGKTNLSIEMESVVYENEEERMRMNTSIKKEGGKYLYNMDNRSMLINDKYLVVVDHKNKSISYDRWTEFQAKQLANMYIPLSKDLLVKYPTVKYEGEKDGVRHYSLYNSEVQMSRVDIFFDTKLGFVKRTIHHYNPKLIEENVYLDMKFKKISTNPTFSENTFSEKQFLIISDKTVNPVEKYKGYSLQAALSYN